MKTAIKTCANCWKATAVMGVVVAANFGQTAISAYHNEFTLPLIFRLFSFH